MMEEEKGKALHDKASRGEKLSVQEKQQLDEWYAQQDQLEMANIQMVNDSVSQSGLQAQVKAALAQLVTLSNKIQRMASENEQLRSENTALLNQIAQRYGRQSA